MSGVLLVGLVTQTPEGGGPPFIMKDSDEVFTQHLLVIVGQSYAVELAHAIVPLEHHARVFPGDGRARLDLHGSWQLDPSPCLLQDRMGLWHIPEAHMRRNSCPEQCSGESRSGDKRPV